MARKIGMLTWRCGFRVGLGHVGDETLILTHKLWATSVLPACHSSGVPLARYSFGLRGMPRGEIFVLATPRGVPSKSSGSRQRLRPNARSGGPTTCGRWDPPPAHAHPCGRSARARETCVSTNSPPNYHCNIKFLCAVMPPMTNGYQIMYVVHTPNHTLYTVVDILARYVIIYHGSIK